MKVNFIKNDQELLVQANTDILPNVDDEVQVLAHTYRVVSKRFYIDYGSYEEVNKKVAVEIVLGGVGLYSY